MKETSYSPFDTSYLLGSTYTAIPLDDYSMKFYDSVGASVPWGNRSTPSLIPAFYNIFFKGDETSLALAEVFSILPRKKFVDASNRPYFNRKDIKAPEDSLDWTIDVEAQLKKYGGSKRFPNQGEI